VWLRRGEIEKLVVDANDDGDVMEDRVGWQIGPLGAGEEPEVAGVPPVGEGGYLVGGDRRRDDRDRQKREQGSDEPTARVHAAKPPVTWPTGTGGAGE
jgi:hypothetical protein